MSSTCAYLGFFKSLFAIGKSRMRLRARLGIAPRSVGVCLLGVGHSGKRQISFLGLRLGVPLFGLVGGIGGRSFVGLPGGSVGAQS